jgi:hypothetical protein
MSPAKTYVSFRAPTSQVEMIEAIAVATGRSRSSVIRDALQREVDSTLAAGAAARAR